MIDTTESPLYKALIALLFESGARINEILPIIVEEVQETEKGMIVGVHETKSKTLLRPVLCIYSAPYIRNLISYHGLSKQDKLFDIGYPSAYKMLVYLGKKAGIKKQTNPHRLRHAQARQMLEERYDPLIINKKLGWSPRSVMRERYTHVVDDDVINATLERAGGEPVRKTPKRLAEPEVLKPIDINRTVLKLHEENEYLKEQIQELKTAFDVIAVRNSLKTA